MARPSYIKDKQVKEKAVTNDTKPAVQARALRVLRDTKDRLEEQLKEVNRGIDTLSVQLAEEMETHGIDSFRVEGVGSVYIKLKHRPNVVDKPGMLAWLDARSMGEMAPRTIHHARLESLVSEMLENGETLPGWVNNFSQKRALIRRK